MNIIKRPVLICGILASFILTTSGVTFQPWRCDQCGGVNVLFCYLQVNGVKVDYHDLQKESELLGTESALTLCQLAAQHGVKLRPVTLTIKQLQSCPMPVIAHIDGPSPDSGAFVLLMNAKEPPIFVNGPSAMIREISSENFLRCWSGVVLLPPTTVATSAKWYLAGLALGTALSVLNWSKVVNLFRGYAQSETKLPDVQGV
ncbi:MAG TPA: cysteine peptidase family C39 domain-containing protein [Verrucomicrobiae bacterium]|nr:cysteine peptidase family C39 domain-containing protein [Verrucomicrobiae bacterium]